MTSLTLPPGYDRIKVVRSFEELVSARFEDGVNAICWPRKLSGDYREVVERLELGVGITTIEEGRLEALLSGEGSLSEAACVAVEVMREDLRRLRELGLEPVLDGV